MPRPHHPPRWGGNASVLAFQAVVNMTDYTTNPVQPNWTFVYSYNWELMASRYEHGVGNSDEVCTGMPGQKEGQPCTVLNALDGFLYLKYPATGYVP